MGKGNLAPLTGVGFFVLAIAAFAVGGEPPDPTEDSVREIIRFYADNEGAQIATAIIATLAGTLIVFFGGLLRSVLREAEGPGGMLSAVAFAGTIILAVALGVDSSISFALADGAGEIGPGGMQTLSYLYNYDFLLFGLGVQVFLFSTGIAIVRHGALPKWIGWVAIVLAVISVTPAGFISFIGSGLLILAISIVLLMRGGGKAAATA